MEEKQRLKEQYQKLGEAVFQNNMLNLFQQAVKQDHYKNYGMQSRWTLFMDGKPPVLFLFSMVEKNDIRIHVWQDFYRGSSYLPMLHDSCHPLLGG